MSVGRQLAWFGLGFAAITALGVVASPRPARAQGTNTSVTAISPPPRAQEVVPRTRGLPTPFDANAETQTRRPAGAPTAPSDDQNGDGQDTGDGNDGDGVTPGAAGQRPTLRDGDLGQDMGPVQEQDGIIDPVEPRNTQDGPEAITNDTRTPEEIALFEAPPAGYDPQLFQAEVDPILDRRPERLFRFEPFDPRGIRLGTFVLLPEVEFGTSYLSNVFRTTQPRSDVTFDVRPTIRLVSNWRVHALEFRATGSFSRFNEFTTENDRAYTLESRARLDLTRRTSLEALAARDVTQESRSSINAPSAAANRADVTTDRFAAALNHRFNRLSLQLRGSVADVAYGPSDSLGGGTIANSDRDVRITEEVLRAAWEFKPTLFTFIETAVNQRVYKMPSLTDGILRDSTGERYRVGVSFGNTSQRLRGEISTGYGTQRPDDTRLREISGVLFDANLAWRYSALTSFLFTAKTDVSETTLANSGGAFSRQFGLEARHGFRRNVIGNAGVSYTTSSYEGVSLRENELRTFAGLEYFVSREVTLFGKYQHTAFESDDRTRNYNADEVRVGVRIRQ